MTRSARGIELTAAGRVFLDHARLALAQVDAAREAARRAAQPAKPSFALGFLTGKEIDWLPEAIRLLRDELPNIEITVSSQYSPDLADALVRGKLDVAFLRREARATDLMFKVVATEPFVAVLPSDHRLASHEVINPQDIVGETFIAVSNTAPVTRGVIDDYLRRSGIDIRPGHEADHMAMAMSFVASTRGVALLPAYARNLLPSSLTSRPLQGGAPTIDLVVGYSRMNTSPILKLFLARIDDLIARVSKETQRNQRVASNRGCATQSDRGGRVDGVNDYRPKSRLKVLSPDWLFPPIYARRNIALKSYMTILHCLANEIYLEL